MMLMISWDHAAGLAMTMVVIDFAAVMFPVDRPNDRATRPIPQAKF